MSVVSADLQKHIDKDVLSVDMYIGVCASARLSGGCNWETTEVGVLEFSRHNAHQKTT